MSAPKNKESAKSDEHWELEWSDLISLCDNSCNRPIAWTESNTLLTSHIYQTLVQTQILELNRPSTTLPFHLSLRTVLGSQATIIEVSPRDEMIFAYFPTKPNDVNYGEYAGMGVIYERGTGINEWNVHSPFTFPVGESVVAAKWLMEDRQWSQTDPPYRLPPQGPYLPNDSHALIVVLESHHVRLYGRLVVQDSLPSAVSQPPSIFYEVNAYLLSPSGGHRRGPTPLSLHPTEHATRVITKAAIGLGYDDTSISIAYMSKLASSPYPSTSQPTSGSLPLFDGDVDPLVPEWEDYVDEPIIELCLLRLSFDNQNTTLRAHPMPPISLPPCASGWPVCTHLQFIPILPPKDDVPEENVAPKLQPIYLATSFVDFHSFTSPPASTLHLFRIQRPKPLTGDTTKSIAVMGHVLENVHIATREFSDGVIIHLSPFDTWLPDGVEFGVLCGTLALSGEYKNFHYKKEQPVEVGSLSVLTLSDLTDDVRWESTPILSPAKDAGRDPPVKLAVSPNKRLIATSAPRSFESLGVRTHLCLAPQFTGVRTNDGEDIKMQAATARESDAALAASLLAGYRSPADIIHSRAIEKTTNSDALHNHQVEPILGILSREEVAGPDWESVLLGFTIDPIRKSSSNHTQLSRTEKRHHDEEWLTARDMLSIMAFIDAFEIAQDGHKDAYELDMIWHLLGLSRWLTSYFKYLMKECILFQSAVETAIFHLRDPANSSSEVSKEDLDKLAATPEFLNKEVSPMLLSVILPALRRRLTLALKQLLNLKTFVDPLTARGDNAAMAKETLQNLLDSEVVNWPEFLAALEALPGGKEEATQSGISETTIPFSFKVPSRLLPEAFEIVKKLTEPNIVFKPRLLQSHESDDGIDTFGSFDKLSLLDIEGDDYWQREAFRKPRFDLNQDVVTKEGLNGNDYNTGLRQAIRICARCSGISDKRSPPQVLNVRWRAWTRRWEHQCLCGGAWVSKIGF